MADAQKVVVVDTETTHYKPYLAKILECAAVVVEGSEIVQSFVTMSNPGKQALVGAEEALKVNGITIAEVEAAPPAETARQVFRRWLAQVGHAPELTSFNLAYDIGVLVGNRWLSHSETLYRSGDCIMLQAQKVMGPAGKLRQWDDGSYKWPSLAEAKAFFGIDVKDVHRALADATAAAKVMIAIQRSKVVT